MTSPSTIPVSFRMDPDLKKRLEDEVGRHGGTSVTSILHEAARQYLAQRCPSCGAMRERANPGLSAAFDSWLRQHDREVIYVVVGTPSGPRAYKGRFFFSGLGPRSLTLTALSSGWNRGDATLLRDTILDWKTGDNASKNDGRFEEEYRGVKLDAWGLDK